MKRIYQRCCGIDVHKATLTACVRLHGAGRKLSQELRDLAGNWFVGDFHLPNGRSPVTS